MHKIWSFPLRTSSADVAADLVTLAEEILNGKLHFFCALSEPCQTSKMDLFAKIAFRKKPVLRSLKGSKYNSNEGISMFTIIF